jgi:hypothetical protein
LRLDDLHIRWASAFYAALLGLSVVAFWPGYLAAPMSSLGGWTHFHAATGTLWLILLIVQPWAIRTGRRDLHAILGRASLLLAALVVIGFIGLANSSMQGKSPKEQAVDAYFFYIRVVLVTIFVVAYVLGVVHRRDPEVHSRYMLCTGLPLLDPVIHRIAQRAAGGADFNYQLLTFGLACVLLLLLMRAARRLPRARNAMGLVLVLFVLGGTPLALDFYKWSTPWTHWKAFAKRFAELPLTTHHLP